MTRLQMEFGYRRDKYVCLSACSFIFGIGRKLFVGTVAQWLVPGSFATTEKNATSIGGRVFYRRKTAALMGTIAKRLVLALSTGTPKIGLVCLDFYGKRGVRSSHWVVHSKSPKCETCMIKQNARQSSIKLIKRG